MLAAVRGVLIEDPDIEAVELIGSRRDGRESPLSDWDFQIVTEEPEAVAGRIPELVEPLHPLARQWDPMGERPTYMLMLPGGVKVDLIFDLPWDERPPWTVTAETLPAVDDHFWDWILWLASKAEKGCDQLVRAELTKLGNYILGPMHGITDVESIEEAVRAYRDARGRLEREYGIEVSRAMDDAVSARLREGGLDV